MKSESNKEKILVIGSSGHKYADKCIEWLQPFDKLYIGNYDIVIVNTQSLSEVTLERMETNEIKTCDRIREELFELMLSSENKLIFIISSPYIASNEFLVSHSGEQIPTNSNYKWCPIELAFKNKIVTEINNDEKFLPGYFKEVKETNHYFDYDYSAVWLNETSRYKLEWRSSIEPLVTSGVKKPISFKVNLSGYLKNAVDSKAIFKCSPVFVIPPPSEITVSEGIDKLIKMMRNVVDELPFPKWTESYTLPSAKKLIELNLIDQKEIQKVNMAIQKIDSEVQKRNTEIAKIDRYKMLLFSEGDVLENIVEEAFGYFDIHIKKPTIENIEDRYFQDQNLKIPIEIKGCDKSANARHIGQLLTRIGDSTAENAKYKTKGLLVLNHYHDLSFDKRLEPFPSNIVETASKFNICLITSKNIFDLVCKKMTGEEIRGLSEKIFNTIGVFKLD